MKSFNSSFPHVVATVTTPDDLDFLDSAPDDLPRMADILEFRLDNLPDHPKALEKTIEGLPSGIGILITARSPREGGVGNLNPGQRSERLLKLLPRCDFIDIEISTLESADDEMADVLGEAKTRGKLTIGSFHDFENCPSGEELSDRVTKARELGFDIPKLAVSVSTFAELNRLLEQVENGKGQGSGISAMGMGSLGKLSRLVLAKAGSCLNYGYLQKENAPGQWPSAKLKSLIEEL